MGNTERILVTTKELMTILSCGRPMAERIGREAGARSQIGRIVRWNIKSIEEYLKGESNVQDRTD